MNSISTLHPLRQTLAREIGRFDPSLPINEAWTPPASWYTDPRFYELERHTVFANRWLYAGRADQVTAPGSYVCGQMLHVPFIVARDAAGKLRAFANVCAHHGTRVADGSGCTKQFTCPYHGWQYDLTGALIKAPKAGGHTALHGGKLGLQNLPVVQHGPFIFINLNDCEQDALIGPNAFLEQFSGSSLDRLQFVRQVRYAVDCNWKVFVDNYLDGGYHVAQMHPGLAGQLNLQQYHSHVAENYALQTCPARSGPARSGPGNIENSQQNETGVDFRERIGDEARYGWLYPNFIVNRYGNWMDTNWVIPEDEHHCTVIFDYYHDGPVDDHELERMLKASDQVQQEDLVVCRLVRDGLKSGFYERGIYAPRFEEPMYRFHQMLHADFTAAASAEGSAPRLV